MYPFLDVLDMDDMPTNSDVVLILSQYIKSMDIFHDKYYGYNSRSGQYEWSTKITVGVLFPLNCRLVSSRQQPIERLTDSM